MDCDLNSKQKPKKIIIDTDAGVDDALAILLALFSPLECKIEAITTVSGNVHVEQVTENVLRILEIYVKSLESRNKSPFYPLPPVYKGESKPLKRPLRNATQVHGNDGLGGSSKMKNEKGELIYPHPKLEYNSSVTAPKAILDILDQYPGEITIITLGPMTNIAVAAQM